MSKFSSQFIDDLTSLAFMLRRGTVRTQHADPKLTWDQPGIRAHIVELTETAGIEPVDVCAVALGCAADLTITTPRLMLTSNRSWKHANTGRPQPRRCEHSVTIENEAPADETKAKSCRQCTPPPVLTTTRKQREKQRRDAIQAAREAKRAERAEYEARQAEAREAEARKQAQRLTEARTEGEQP